MATDLDRFVREAQGLRGAFFDRERPITVARAPGWVDLLGGAAPAGGALALGWPLGAGSFVALQPDPAPSIRLRDAAGQILLLPLDVLAADGAPHAYDVVAGRVAALPEPARLAAAAWSALMREEFVRFPGGARVLLHAAAGPGAPVGPAAALAQALVSAYGVRLAPRELGLSVGEGLRRIVGHDPGALGALVSVCAYGGSLLLLHQQPAWLWGDLHLPHGYAIWAVRVGDGPPAPADAPAVAAALVCRLAAEAAGLSIPQADARWRGYPANIGTALFYGRLQEALPTRMRGAEILARLGPLPGHTVRPRAAYPVRAAAALAVEEHLRARTAAALLRAAASKAQRDDDLHLLGELMAQSHAAQRAAGLGDAQGDALAERVLVAGAAQGLFGARAPAAASGASLVVLGAADAEPALRAICDEYAAETGLRVLVFGGSSSGCSSAGTREI